MILRVVHAAVPPEKKKTFIEFINSTLAPAIRKFPGCQFMYVADCIEKGHENEVIYVSGWDKFESCQALERTNVYPDAAVKAKTFYTERFNEHGAIHIHYKTFADFK